MMAWMLLFEHDVGGLEIAVDDAGVVCRLQPLGDLTRDGHDVRDRQPPGLSSGPGQIVPFDERHRDVLDAVDLSHVVNAHDVACASPDGPEAVPA